MMSSSNSTALPRLNNSSESKRKKKRRRIVNIEKTKHFSANVDKQLVFKSLTDHFLHWKTWQRKIFLCKCTLKSTYQFLLSLSTAMEPVYHHDLNIGSIRPLSHTGVKFPILQSNSTSCIGSPNSHKDRQKTSSDVFSPINLLDALPIKKTQHNHFKERSSDSLSTIDFIHEYRQKKIKPLGDLVTSIDPKRSTHGISELKHKAWWSESVKTSSKIPHLKPLTKLSLLQSFRNTTDDFLLQFVKWTNAEQGDFLLNLFEFCDYEELIFLANCIQERLKEINDINRLPEQIMLKIFSYLDIDDLISCTQVCKHWRMITANNSLWKAKSYELARKYKQQAILNYLETVPTYLSWKDIYKGLSESIQQLVIDPCSSIDLPVEDDDYDDDDNDDNIEYDQETIESSEHLKEENFTDLNSSGGISDLKRFLPIESLITPFYTMKDDEDDTTLTCTGCKSPEKEIIQNIYSGEDVDAPVKEIAFDVRPKLVQPVNEFKEQQNVKGDSYMRIPIPGIRTLKRVRKLQGHLEAIFTLQFDKKRVMTGSADRTVRLWDLRSGRNFHKLIGHQGGIRCLQFDSDYIVTGSWDTTVIVWDVVSFNVVQTITKHNGCVSCLEITDKYLITGSHDTKVCIFEKHTWELLDTLSAHKGPVSCLVVVSEDELLTGSHDMTMILWDIYDGVVKRKFRHPNSPILCAKVTGDLIAAGTFNGSLAFWNKETGDIEGIIKAHDGATNALCFVGTKFVTGGNDGLVKEWDLETCTCLRSLTSHKGAVLCVRASIKRIISGSSDGTVKIWDMVCTLQQIGGGYYDEINKIIIPTEVVNEREWRRRQNNET